MDYLSTRSEDTSKPLLHRSRELSWPDHCKRTFDDHADLILDGCGVLNKWKWPDIPGLHDFKGDLLHSAQWNQNVSLKGKRVALIGAGSSAVQILPNIIMDADHIYHWVRNRIWITAGFAQAFAGPSGANFKYNDDQLELFRTQPDAYLTYCKMIEAELNQRFSFIINGSKAQNDARAFSENEMRTLLKEKPELVDKIMQVLQPSSQPRQRTDPAFSGLPISSSAAVGQLQATATSKPSHHQRPPFTTHNSPKSRPQASYPPPANTSPWTPSSAPRALTPPTSRATPS